MNSEIYNKRPLVIAHRGDTKSGLENTLPALASALQMGIDGIETDLRITSDGQVVLFHDDDLKRLAGRPETVESLPLAEVRKVSLNGGFSIPTLEELLDLAKEGDLLNLELKTAHPLSGRLERATLAALNRFSKRFSLLISSFQPIRLWRMHRLAPEVATGYLFEKNWALHRWILPFVRTSAIHPPITHLKEVLNDPTRRTGRRVFVWTVNDENDMRECLNSGVNGVITDEPRKLLGMIHGH